MVYSLMESEGPSKTSNKRLQGLGPVLLPPSRTDISFLKGEKKKSLGLFHNIFSLYNVLYLKNKK